MSRPLAAVILAAATFAFAVPTHGQQRMWAGARLGFTSSTLGAEYARLLNARSRSTFTASIVFGAHVTRHLAIQPELAYVQKGARVDFTPASAATIDIRYIEFQFPLVLIPIPQGRLRPKLYSGIAGSVELSCDVQGSFPGGDSSTRCGWQDPLRTVLVFTQTSLVEMGWLVGAGLDLALGPGAVTADLRYNLGLSDINDIETVSINGVGAPLRVENRALQVVAGYVLYLGGPFAPPRRFPDRRGSDR